MKTLNAIRSLSAGALLFSGAWFGASNVAAQTLAEMQAAQSMQNNLNAAPVAPGGGSFNPIARAQDAAGQPPTGAALPQPPPAFGGPPPGPGGFPGFGGGGPGALGIPGLPTIIEPRVAVISGTRVFDAITKELLDDASEVQVPESQKENYYDDGTHGDIEANDGKYTRTDESRDFLSQTNQRVKEQLVQALLKAQSMSPLEFFGYTLMSTERSEAVSRNRAWKLVPDPQGGPGFVLAEVPIEKPLEVPKFRDQLAKQNEWIRDNWADRFLQEFRKSKDSLTSEFYPLYIPVPPIPPATAPPLQWIPFASATQAMAANPAGAGPGGPPVRQDFNSFGQAPPAGGVGVTNPFVPNPQGNLGVGTSGSYYNPARLN